jgi:hypothetical protein
LAAEANGGACESTFWFFCIPCGRLESRPNPSESWPPACQVTAHCG